MSIFIVIVWFSMTGQVVAHAEGGANSVTECNTLVDRYVAAVSAAKPELKGTEIKATCVQK